MPGLYRHLDTHQDADGIAGPRRDAGRRSRQHAWDGDVVPARVRRPRQPGRLEGRATRGRSSSRARAGASSAAPAVATARPGARASVRQHLATPNGIVLQQPAYSTYHVELGEVSTTRPAIRKTPGSSPTTTPGFTRGWAMLGDGDQAFAYYLGDLPLAQGGADRHLPLPSPTFTRR